jgi:hypothetical protein
MKLFETAARKKYRFESVRGQLTTEQLFDLPLKNTKTNFDLDSVAQEVDAELKIVAGQTSFVSTTASTATTDLENKLEIVKYVISDKIASQAAANDSVKKAEERRKLFDLLAEKENAELAGLSKEEILKKIDELA